MVAVNQPIQKFWNIIREIEKKRCHENWQDLENSFNINLYPSTRATQPPQWKRDFNPMPNDGTASLLNSTRFRLYENGFPHRLNSLQIDVFGGITAQMSCPLSSSSVCRLGGLSNLHEKEAVQFSKKWNRDRYIKSNQSNQLYWLTNNGTVKRLKTM